MKKPQTKPPELRAFVSVPLSRVRNTIILREIDEELIQTRRLNNRNAVRAHRGKKAFWSLIARRRLGA
jgi:hypothetical protein